MTNGKYRLKYSARNVFGTILVNYTNDVLMGEMIVGDDGYYAWWPERGDGYIDSWILRELADKLDDLNKEWNDQVQNDTTIS